MSDNKLREILDMFYGEANKEAISEINKHMVSRETHNTLMKQIQHQGEKRIEQLEAELKALKERKVSEKILEDLKHVGHHTVNEELWRIEKYLNKNVVSVKKFKECMKDVPPEYAEVINKHFWELINRGVE